MEARKREIACSKYSSNSSLFAIESVQVFRSGDNKACDKSQISTSAYYLSCLTKIKDRRRQIAAIVRGVSKQKNRNAGCSFPLTVLFP